LSGYRGTGKRVVSKVIAGEEVVVTGDDALLFTMVPSTKKRKAPRLGTAAGQVVMSPDFDAPLEEFAPYTE
jgi:antitoxin (DNA-binding transcriptional repressor) of toxin-antitoxin stability system